MKNCIFNCWNQKYQLMKITLCLLFYISIFTSTICFSQNKWTLEVGGGIIVSKPNNIDKVIFGQYFEDKPLINLNGYIKNSLHLKNGLGVYLRTGYMVTGFEANDVAGYHNNDLTRPFHLQVDWKFHYYDVTGGAAFHIKNTKMFVGMKYLTPVKTMVTTKRTGLFDAVNGTPSNLYIESIEEGYQVNTIQEMDLAIEVGFQHNFWKNFYFEFYYFIGFLPINFLNPQGHKLYNQGVNLSLGYQFNLIK